MSKNNPTNPSIVTPDKKRWTTAAVAAAALLGGTVSGALRPVPAGMKEPAKPVSAAEGIPQTTVPPTIPGLILSERPNPKVVTSGESAGRIGDTAEDKVVRAAGSAAAEVTGDKDPWSVDVPLTTVPTTSAGN